MAFATWMRALSAVGTVAEATRFFRGSGSPAEAPPVTTDDAAGLETRLANVVVAALREAFDRDRARFDLERDFHEAEEARKERAIRLEWLRQTGTQALSHTGYLAALSVVVWLASVAATGWLAPLGAGAKGLLGLGWLCLAGAVGAALVTHQRLTAWLARSAVSTEPGSGVTPVPTQLPELPAIPAQAALPWLFLAGFVAIAMSLVIEL